MSLPAFAAASYLTHTANDDTVVDVTFAIDKRAGLAVCVENEIKTGGDR
jgi:hypothetical protein